MVKISHPFMLIAATYASEDAEAMLQVGKHAPALAQTDSTVRTSRHQQALQMESNFEKLAAEAVRTGQSPSLGAEARGAVNDALDTLEEELKKEKTANDAQMEGANAQCAQCNKLQNDAFTDGVNSVDATKSSVEQARKTHADCRATEEDTDCGDEKTKCDDQDDYATEAHGAGPHCPCEAFDTAQTQKHCLENAVDWGTKYNTVLGDKITACDGAKEVANEVAPRCDGDQKSFEMAFCSYKVSLTTTCQSHSACYEAAVLDRETVMTSVQTKEASEKIMWKSCKKVRCYLDMLDADQVTQEGFNDCKKLDTNTTHLDVVYPDAPAKEVCDTTPVNTVPGDPAWLAAEYARLAPTKSWLKARKGIEDVTPCTNTAAISVQPIATPTVVEPLKVEPEFFLAEGGKSCTAACQAASKTCDAKQLSQAASSVNTCKSIIESLGMTPTKGGQYSDDDSGCTYHPGQSGWYQLMRKNGDAECDAVNSDQSRQRVCACDDVPQLKASTAPTMYR